MSDKEDTVCVWAMGTPCSEEKEVSKKMIFDEQLYAPICENHFKEHMDIMVLAANNYDIEKVLEMTWEDRRHEVITLTLSGLNVTDVKP